jgi:hypothetical protein
MARKTWVDVDAFIEAFGIALRVHGAKLAPVDQTILASSLAQARQIAGTR